MNKKLAIIAIACTISILIGGINQVILYGTQYITSKETYTFTVGEGPTWWDCDWSYSKKIIIDHNKVEKDQYYFPVLIYNSSDTDLRDHAQSDGDDIVFVDQDNLTKYDHQIEKYDSTTGELIAWVEVTTILSNTDTILYMYYGNPDCSNQQNIGGTWNANYRLVQHLNETTGNHIDSTNNHNNGTISGTVTQDSTYSNQLDGCDYFPDGTGSINFGNDSSLTFSQFTLEAWVKDPPPQSKSVRIVDKRQEHLSIFPNHRFTVERTIAADTPTYVVFIALYSSGVQLEDMYVNDESVYSGIYYAGIPQIEEEQTIEAIRNKLPENIQKHRYIAYSKPFRIATSISVEMQFNTEGLHTIFPDGSISYLVIAGDGQYDFEGTTHWNNILSIWFPSIYPYELIEILRNKQKDVSLEDNYKKLSKNDLFSSIESTIEKDGNARVIIRFTEEKNSFIEQKRYLEELGFLKTAEVDSKRAVAGYINRSMFESIKENQDIYGMYLDTGFDVLMVESLPLIRFNQAVEEFGVTGKGTKICILDTGIDPTVISYSYGYDFVNDDSDPMDDQGHGTQVATVLKSIAPDAELVVAKVIGSDGTGYESDVLEGLQWCIDQHPDVISFSIGSSSGCSGFCDADLVADLCNDAIDQGVFVVAASGNSGGTSLKSPACGSKVFSVGATDDNDDIADFSSVNPTLDLFAPGVDIITVAGTMSGTSMSAPHVAAAACLVLENELLSPRELSYRLRSTGRPIKYMYNDSLHLDIGRLDVYNAIVNNKTFEPYDYSWWWQDVISTDKKYGLLSNWWNSNWSYRKLVTINSSQVDADLINFPVLVYEASDSDLASNAQDDGDDIAFVLYSDNTTQLNHEIELFNGTTGELVAWVNVTSLSSSVDTKIWMYYGNSTCSSQENIVGTWDVNYSMVQHLNESTGTLYDSTSHDNDATVNSATYNASTKINGGYDFGGDGDYINVSSDITSLHRGTIMVWGRLRNYVSGKYPALAQLGGGVASSLECGIFVYSTTDIKGCSQDLGVGYINFNVPVATANNTWILYVLTWDGTDVKTYVNETRKVTESQTGDVSTDGSIRFGALSGHNFNGTLDEVRVSSIARNQSWIGVVFNNTNSPGTFLSFSSQQIPTAPVQSGEVPANGSTDVGIPPSLYVLCTDINEDNMNATWWSNSSGSWAAFATNTSFANNTNISQTNSNFSSLSTTYYWSVNLTDGIYWTNDTYHFTTGSNFVPTINELYISPASPYTNSTLICYFNVSDDNGDSLTVNVTWYRTYTNGSANVSWTADNENDITATNNTLCNTTSVGNIEWNDTHWGEKWMVHLSVWDGNDTVVSNSSQVEIDEYPTNLTVFDQEQDDEGQAQSDDTRVYVNEYTRFYANYSCNTTGDIDHILMRTGDIGYLPIVRAFDYNGDGVRDDIVIAEQGDLWAYDSSGNELWHKDEPTGYMYEMRVADMDLDGYDDVAVIERDGYLRIYNTTGTEIFATSSLGTLFYTMDVGDCDGDGNSNDVIVGGYKAAYKAFGFIHDGSTWKNVWNATEPTASIYEIKIQEYADSPNLFAIADYSDARGRIYYTSNGTEKWSSPTDLGTIYSVTFADLDNDGIKDEVVYGELADVLAYDVDGNYLWTADEPLSYIYELQVMDLDNDGYEDDVVAIDSFDTVRGFNNAGDQLWFWTMPHEINQHINPTNWGILEVADVNDDGEKEILVSGSQRTIWILNRTGCVVGRQYFGFETGSDGFDSCGSIYGSSNYIQEIADINNDGITDFIYCRASGYGYMAQQVLMEIRFSDDPDRVRYMDFNITSGLYEFTRKFNESDFDMSDYDTNTYTWNVTARKGGYETRTSANKEIIVHNKNASIDAFDQENDDEDKAGWLSEDQVEPNEDTYFFANLTDLENNQALTELGFHDIWTKDHGGDTWSIAFADADQDGYRDEVIIGGYGNYYAYEIDGTQLWVNTTPGSTCNEMDIGDLNGTGYYDHAVMPNVDDHIYIVNTTNGDFIWDSGDIGDSMYSVEVGDLDKDGEYDDFVVGFDDGPNYAVAGYNTTDGKIWNQMWKKAGTSDEVDFPFEVHVTDFNDSFDYNYVTWSGYGRARYVLVYSTNGTFVYPTGADTGCIRSCAFIDLDHDGRENETIFGEDGDLRAVDDKGNELWIGDTTLYTYDIIPIDLDDDGWEDECIVTDYRYVRAFDENGNVVWTYQYGNTQQIYYSAAVADINKDGEEEILAANYDDIIYILNKTGVLLYKYEVKDDEYFTTQCVIGYIYGSQGQMCVSEETANGTRYIAFCTADTFDHLIEATPRVIIEFSDGTSSRMDYNSTEELFYYNRSFSSAGVYSWWINSTCENFVSQYSGGKTITINTFPWQSGEVPKNESTNIGITPSLYVLCIDNDSHNMNATWWSNSSGSWVAFATNTSFANNTNITQTNSNFSSYGLKYYWSVNLSDGWGGWTNKTYHFTTGTSGGTPVAPDIRVWKDGTDAVISWDPVTAATGGGTLTCDNYSVYRGTTFDFIPGPCNLLYNGTSTQVRDSPALSNNTNYSYLVYAYNHTFGNLSSQSNMGYVLHKSLIFWTTKTDKNWVSLPWYNNNYSTVSDLVADLSPSGDPVVSVANLTWDQTHEYYTYSSGWSGTNFDIISGRGYQMNATSNTTICLVGANKPNGTIFLNENPSATDLNWVSIPYNSNYSTVSDIVTSWSSSGENVTSITNLRDDQMSESYTWDDIFEVWTGTDFVIEPGRGYQFVTQGATDNYWNPDEGDSENHAPTIDLISPANGSTGISSRPHCKIWANDTDCGDLTVYWYENSTGSYLLRNTNSSVSPNSIVSYTFTEFNTHDVTYYWKVIVNDTLVNTTAVHHFTLNQGTPVAPDIRVWKDSNDAIIYWDPVTTSTEGGTLTCDNYSVYRWTTFDFEPKPCNILYNGTSTQVRDSPALSNTTNYSYIVFAYNHSFSNLSSQSNRGFVLHKPLKMHSVKTDKNWVSLPWYNNNYSTVSDLVADLSPSGDPVVSVANLTWDQTYEYYSYSGGWSGTNFDIIPDRSYQMNATSNTTICLVGANKPNGTIFLNENPSASDRNWVSLPYNSNYSTVSDIVASWSSSGENITTITNLNNNQQYESYTWIGMWIGSNFAIEPGRGYEMVATTDNNWNPTEESNENHAPTITLVNPANGSTGISPRPHCKIWANDTDCGTLNIYWYENSTGSYVLRNTNNSVSPNSQVGYTFTEFTTHAETYYWKVAVNDSEYNTTAVYYFTVNQGTPVAPDIRVWKDGTDAILYWDPVTDSTEGGTLTCDNYSVYRWTTFDFEPKPCNILYNGTSTQVRDSPALSNNTNYSYLVLAYNHSFGTLSSNSNMGYVLHKTLKMHSVKTDMNWVSLPWYNNNYSTVSDLVADLSPSGSPVVSVANLSYDQSYEYYTYSGGWSGTNFDIIPGRAYQMNATSNTTICLVGANKPNGTIFLNENTGATNDKNWVSIPYNSNYSTVSDITDEYSPNGETISKIIWLEESTQSYWSWIHHPVLGWYGNHPTTPDFQIEPGVGYEMHAVTDNYWNPTEESNENHAPTITLVNPTNGSTDVSPLPHCKIWANDTDCSSLTVYWYENTTGSYILRNTNSSVNPNSLVSYTFTEFNSYSELYYWKVIVNDTEVNTTGVHHFRTNWAPWQSGEVPKNGSTDVAATPSLHVLCIDNDSHNMNATWWSNSSGSWVAFGTNTSFANNTNITQTNSNFSSSGQKYYWSVNLSDGHSAWTNRTYHFTAALTTPTVITNASTGVEETNATLHAYLQDAGGGSCTVRFEYGTTTSYGTNTTNQTKSAGDEFSAEITGLSNGTLYHYRAFANNSALDDTGDDMIFLTKPQPPSGFTATTYNQTQIDLSWAKGDGTNNTYIRRKKDWYPADRSDGVLVYNGTLTSYSDTSLDQKTRYYYRAWSYTTWTCDGTEYQQWSDEYDNDTAATTTIKLINCSTDRSIYGEEDTVTFTAWVNADVGSTVALLLANSTSNLSSASYGSRGSCIANSSNTVITSQPQALTATLSATANITWYAKACDSAGRCSYMQENTSAWNKTYYLGGGTAQSIAADSSNNVYVVGYGKNLNDTNTGWDWSIMRFNAANGVRDWNKTYTGGSSDIAYSVAIDLNNNMSVVGKGNSLNGSNDDWWIMRFNGSTENRDWNKTYSHWLFDCSRGVATDSHNNVYVVGDARMLNDTTTFCWWIMKFNGTTGNREWNRTYNGNGSTDYAYAVATDSHNNVYVVGYGTNMNDSTSQDWWIMRFNGTTGNRDWNKTYNGLGGIDEARDVAIDSHDNVYIIGYGADLNGSTGYDWWIMRFNGSTGNRDWNKTYDCNGSNDIAYSVAVDSNDNVYVAGYGTSLNGSTSTDWWIKKFNSNGAEDIWEWNKTYDGNSSADYLYAVTTDTDDNVYLGGYGTYLNGSTGSDWWIKKFEYITGSYTIVTETKEIIKMTTDTYAMEITPNGTILYGWAAGTSIQTNIDTDWHYVAVTYDESNLKLYKDGVLQNSQALSDSISYPGTIPDVTSGTYLTGYLDELRISNTARSTEWINTTYQNLNDPTSFARFESPKGVLSTWTYRKKITFNSSLVDTTLTNFPALIYNASDTNLSTNALSTGNDIIFLNNTVEWTRGTWRDKLDHEIERYNNTTGELVAWVRIPTLSSSSDTEIYMYYGNTICTTNRENIEGVWDINYSMVQHLEETSDPHEDSTSNNNRGNESGGVNQSATGKIDGADWFDGVNDYIWVNDSDSLDITGDITLETWINWTNGANTIEVIIKKDLNYILRIQDDSGSIQGYYWTTSQRNTITSDYDAITGTWLYIVLIKSGSTYQFYVNSSAVTTNSATSSQARNLDNILQIGSGRPYVVDFEGKIDEVRISNIARNTSWINATHNTTHNSQSFTTFGIQEIKNVAPTLNNPSPSDDATEQEFNPTLSITVNDTNSDAMNITFRTNATGNWGDIDSNNSVYNGTYIQTNSSMDHFNTTYYWSVNATDGTNWTNTTYSFTTIVNHTYICDDSDAQGYEGWDDDGSFNDNENEFTSTDYNNIDEDDDNNVNDANQDDDYKYQYHRFNFTIDEPLSSINNINITWKGWGGDWATTVPDTYHAAYSLWMKESGSWSKKDNDTQTSGMMPWIPSKDTLTTQKTDNFDEWIVGGYLEVAAQSDYYTEDSEGMGPFSILKSYYIKVVIS